VHPCIAAFKPEGGSQGQTMSHEAVNRYREVHPRRAGRDKASPASPIARPPSVRLRSARPSNSRSHGRRSIMLGRGT
jgi:hypothetical protein